MMALFLPALAGGCNGQGDPAKATEGKEEKDEPKEAHVTVKVLPARLGSLAATVEALGRCEALPDHLATLTPAVEGHVHDLKARQGDTVKKGQSVVELDRAVASADLAEKSATRDGLKASLALLKSLPRADERKANELAIEQAKLNVERTRRVAERLRPLLARNDVSDQQVYEADQAAAQAVLAQQTAEAQLRAMLIGPRPEAVAEAEAKITTADAAVAFSRAHLELHTIRSPIDGVLDSLTCHPGQTIAIGSPIGEVVDTRTMFVVVWLAPRPSQSVRAGQTATIGAVEGIAPGTKSEGEPKDEKGDDEKKSDGEHKGTAEHQSEGDHKSAGESKSDHDENDEAEEAIHGKVDFVGRVADQQTGNLPVRILVENPEGQLTVGETVRATIVVEERPEVLQVPSAAIVDQGEGPTFSVVREGKTVVLHPEEVGQPRAGWVAVAGKDLDLKAGEPVIVEGGYNLPEGTPVIVAQAGEKTGEEKEAGQEKGEGKQKKEKDEGKEKGEHKAGAEAPGAAKSKSDKASASAEKAK